MGAIARWVLVATACAPMACDNSQGGDQASPPNEPSEQERTAWKDRAQTIVDRLIAVRDAFPDAESAQEDTCGREVKDSRILLIDWNALVKITRGDDSLRADELSETHSFRSGATDGFLRPGHIGNSVKDEKAKRLEKALAAYEAATYIAVARAHSVSRGSGGLSTMSKGKVEAWIVWFRLEDAKLMCLQRVVAESSNSVGFQGDRLNSHKNASSKQRALDRDLESRYEMELRETMKDYKRVL